MMHLRETRGGEQRSNEIGWRVGGERERERKKKRDGERNREEGKSAIGARERLLCIIMTNSEAICMLN